VRTKRQERIRAALFLVAAAGAIAVALIAYGFGFLNNFERQSIDMRFAIRGNEGAPKDIVLVQIDSKTFNALQQQWPFPRSLHAKLLDRVDRADPAAILFDVQFTEPSADPAQDNALIEAVARTKGKTILSTTEVADNGQTSVFGGGEILREIGARVGNSNFPTDRDGVIRRVSYEIDGLKTVPIVTAEVARRKPISSSELGGSTGWIDYAGPPGTIRAVSYSDVLRGKVPPAALRDKVVVIGATAPSLQDLHDASTGALMPGPEIQANAIETALRGFPLRSAPTWLNTLLILALGLVAPLISLRASPIVGIAAAAASGALFVVCVLLLAFQHGWVVSFV
jgi:adenylate cyclase